MKNCSTQLHLNFENFWHLKSKKMKRVELKRDLTIVSKNNSDKSAHDISVHNFIRETKTILSFLNNIKFSYQLSGGLNQGRPAERGTISSVQATAAIPQPDGSYQDPILCKSLLLGYFFVEPPLVILSTMVS